MQGSSKFFIKANIEDLQGMSDQELIEHLTQHLDQVDPRVLTYTKKYLNRCKSFDAVPATKIGSHLEVSIAALIEGINPQIIRKAIQKAPMTDDKISFLMLLQAIKQDLFSWWLEDASQEPLKVRWVREAGVLHRVEIY